MQFALRLREIVAQVENKSAREVERFLVAQNPKVILAKESVRPISETHSQHTVILSSEVLAKLEVVRSLLGPKGATCSLAELISEMATLAESALRQKKFGNKNAEAMGQTVSVKTFEAKDSSLGKKHYSMPIEEKDSSGSLETKNCTKSTQGTFLSLDPFVDSLFEGNKETVGVVADGKPLGVQAQTAVNSFSTSKVNVEFTKTQSKNQRYISASIKAYIWRRDKGCCQKCGTTRNLNFDHIMPIAYGGASESHNLRLLCFSCNSRQWVRNAPIPS
ncbi:MAG: hypothetical protein COT74_01155 [Bdellovibrionales bacterium CG10_big_fil_rev_8_21_14_0_10_45_34]|nr:MAG: hypothetical protein COT74_01155 [Bdellovibrionales bacterium CG10_big_fil_rev_8_21_14_0_10_45_34]